MSFAKFVRTPFVTEHLWTTASEGEMVESNQSPQPAPLLKKDFIAELPI